MAIALYHWALKKISQSTRGWVVRNQKQQADRQDPLPNLHSYFSPNTKVMAPWELNTFFQVFQKSFISQCNVFLQI